MATSIPSLSNLHKLSQYAIFDDLFNSIVDQSQTADENTFDELFESVFEHGQNHGAMIQKRRRHLQSDNDTISNTVELQDRKPSVLLLRQQHSSLAVDGGSMGSGSTIGSGKSFAGASKSGTRPGGEQTVGGKKRGRSKLTEVEPEIYDSGYKGVTFALKEGLDPVFSAQISVFGRKVLIGTFSKPMDAAQAQDRALLRVFGVRDCPVDDLNYPVNHYARDPMYRFSQFDIVIKKGLFGCNDWKGPSNCDFSHLIASRPVDYAPPIIVPRKSNVVLPPTDAVSNAVLDDNAPYFVDT